MTSIVGRCPGRFLSGAACMFPAGNGTGHSGYGTCSRHGGKWPQSEELWRQAMEIAKREEITPTEAMLSLVKVAMGRAAYVDAVLTEGLRRHVEEGGDPLVPPSGLRVWMKESRNERMLAARTAKAAVDAGVMTALAQRLDLEGTMVADTVNAVLDSLDLTTEQRTEAFVVAQKRLLSAGELDS